MPVTTVVLSEPARESPEQTEFRFIRAPGNWVRITKVALFRAWRCTSRLSFSICWGIYRDIGADFVAAVAQEEDDLAESFARMSIQDVGECSEA